jgi:transcriptional regulator PpsR
MPSLPSNGPQPGSTIGEIAADAPEHSHTPAPFQTCKPPPAVAVLSFPVNVPSVSDTAAPLIQAFANLPPSDAASLLIAASDLTMLVDARGIVRDLQVGSAELAALEHDDWLGRAWSEIVSVESRPKVKALLHEAHQASAQASTQRWRHINHTTPQGQDLPMLYSVLPAGEGQVLAIGRDLRPFTRIQERLIAAQQAMQRDYVRLRQLESRFRALFQAIAEPVLIVDASSLKIVETNPAAADLFADTARKLFGRQITDCFDAASGPKLQALLDSLRGTRHTEASPQRLSTAAGTMIDVCASIFRLDGSTLFLVRIPGLQTGSAEPIAPGRRPLVDAIDHAPDAFVVTEPSGRVIYANLAFAELVQLDSPESAIGESLDLWLGRSGVDLGVMMASLRQGDAVRLFPTLIRSRFGNETSVEISAAPVLDARTPCLGFTLRDIDRRPQTETREGSGLSRAVGQLTELVGRVPLKDIVGQTTDMIEQMCIEAALHLTRDNRAAAAEMLGLSRQSLYVKLRRYGLGELSADDGQSA